MSLGPWQIIIIVLLIVLLFGRGKISDLMGDVAKGITSFKKGLKDGAAEEAAEDGSSDNAASEDEGPKKQITDARAAEAATETRETAKK